MSYSFPDRSTFEEKLNAKLLALKAPGSFDSYMDPELAAYDYDEKSLTLRFHVKPWMLNVDGILHGGLYACMADCVMGSISCFYTGTSITPSVSLHINFIRPAKAGDVLYFRGQVRSIGRTMVHATKTAWREDVPDKELLTGTGVFYNPASRA